MKLSIVIPCFNEQESIPNLATKLAQLREKLSVSHELVFIDDGSRDKTFELLREKFQKKLQNNITILKHDINRGLGAALRTGFAACAGEYIASIDSDCTYEPLYLIDMLSKIEESGADMITASPYHPRGGTIGVPAPRLFLSNNLSRLYNLILGFNIYTYTSMFRIYRAEALQKIDFKSDGFLAMAEILIKLVQQGHRVIEFPATLTVRKYGTSSVRILQVVRNHLRMIAKIVFNKIFKGY